MPQTPNTLLNNQHPQLNYDPGYLLDTFIRRLGLKNDAALARHLEVAPPVISKTHNGKLAIGASLLLRLHEVTGISIKDLRALMGDHRASFRLEEAQFVQLTQTNTYSSATSRTAPRVGVK